MKVSERWRESSFGDGAHELEAGVFVALAYPVGDGEHAWEMQLAVDSLSGLDEYGSPHGQASTLESAQLAAESWLRERAMEILAVVGEEQR